MVCDWLWLHVKVETGRQVQEAWHGDRWLLVSFRQSVVGVCCVLVVWLTPTSHQPRPVVIRKGTITFADFESQDAFGQSDAMSMQLLQNMGRLHLDFEIEQI